jgi:hypothetical protein
MQGAETTIRPQRLRCLLRAVQELRAFVSIDQRASESR